MNDQANPPAEQTPEADIFSGRCAHGTGGPMRYGVNSNQRNEWRPDGTCSYCGGVRPSLALAAMKAGAEVIPTDKGYKIYVMMPDPNAGKERIFGASNTEEKPSGEGWVKWDNARAEAEGWGVKEDPEDNWMLIGPTPAIAQTKVYTNHFSQAQAVELVTLIETRQLKIGVPGHFYSGLAFSEYKAAITAAVAEIRKAKFDAAKAAEGTGQPPAPETPDKPATE